MTMSTHLDEVWGNRPAAFDQWLIDPAGVPQTLRDLSGLLKRLPPDQIIVRTTAGHPGGDMNRLPIPSLATPDGLGDFLGTPGAHVMVIDLQDISDAYAALLSRFVAFLRPILERRKIEVVRPMVGLFLSSPGSVVHLHADPENNFLLQIAGRKEVHVFPNDDALIFPWKDREELFARRKHRLLYRPEFEAQASVSSLGPGMSIYQPALCPHWVVAGSETCVSIGFSIFTTAERRKRRVHLFNHKVRRLGLKPRPPGESAWRDQIKVLGGGMLDGARGMAGRLLGAKA